MHLNHVLNGIAKQLRAADAENHNGGLLIEARKHKMRPSEWVGAAICGYLHGKRIRFEDNDEAHAAMVPIIRAMTMDREQLETDAGDHGSSWDKLLAQRILAELKDEGHIASGIEWPECT